MPELKPSAPADVKPRSEKLIELPESQSDGSMLVLRIGQKYASDLWAETGAMHALAEVPTGKRARLVGKEAEELLAKIAAAGILEPRFSFGERVDGCAFWDDLSFANRAFVVNEIMGLAGIHFAPSMKDGEEAAAGRLATFPDGKRRRVGNGGRTPATVAPAPKASASGRGARRRTARSGERSGVVGDPGRAAAS